MEAEGDSISTVSSEEGEEHKLLDVDFQSSNASTDHYGRLEGGSGVRNNNDIDPFSFYPPLTKWDYLKVTINVLWLLPLRLIFLVVPSIIMGVIVCTLAIICDRFNEDDPQPLNKWGRFVLNNLGKIASRIMLFGFGFNWIHTRGEQAPTKEAPILVVSPHSTLLDMFIISLYKVPTYLARADLRNIPIFGKLITKTLRTIYVEREDPESRMKAAEEIRRRTHTRGEWPKVLIFPEGTTTNRRAIISFKQGAFLPKLPVQPVLLKFKNKLSTAWADDKYGLIKSLLLTLCQIHNSLEVEFLPIYHPSDEELSDTRLYARNVQILMARTLGVPHTNHSLEDMLLMRTAVQAGLPSYSGIVVYHNAASDLSMNLKAMKKWLRRFAAINVNEDGYITVEDLSRFLHLPNDACLQAVVRATDKVGDGRVTFRSYLYDVIGKAKQLLCDASFMHSMFEFFDTDGDGSVSASDLSRQLPISSLPRFTEDHHDSQQQRQPPGCDVSYQNPEGTVPERMDFEQFSSLLSDHPEYVLIFYECQHAGISSPPHTSASLVTNGNQHSSSVAAAKPGGVSDEHEVDRHGQVIEPVSKPILT